MKEEKEKRLHLFICHNPFWVKLHISNHTWLYCLQEIRFRLRFEFIFPSFSIRICLGCYQLQNIVYRFLFKLTVLFFVLLFIFIIKFVDSENPQQNGNVVVHWKVLFCSLCVRVLMYMDVSFFMPNNNPSY